MELCLPVPWNWMTSHLFMAMWDTKSWNDAPMDSCRPVKFGKVEVHWSLQEVYHWTGTLYQHHLRPSHHLTSPGGHCHSPPRKTRQVTAQKMCLLWMTDVLASSPMQCLERTRKLKLSPSPAPWVIPMVRCPWENSQWSRKRLWVTCGIWTVRHIPYQEVQKYCLTLKVMPSVRHSTSLYIVCCAAHPTSRTENNVACPSSWACPSLQHDASCINWFHSSLSIQTGALTPHKRPAGTSRSCCSGNSHLGRATLSPAPRGASQGIQAVEASCSEEDTSLINEQLSTVYG